MTEKGFAVERPWYGMDTAFAARWGTEGPCVAFLAEYDALPGYGENGDQAGHACGHNLIAMVACGSGIAMREFADELGGEIVYKSYPQAETVDINGTECYVFISRGVPAKELNTKEYVRVMSASGGESRLEAYSAEDYLYQKLYGEAYAAKTAEDVGADGKDYLRRTLYYDLLKYGAIAQELLAPDAADKIGDTVYAYAPAAVATLGELEAGTRMVLKYDEAFSDEEFLGWEYTRYDALGEVVETGYAADGSAFYAEGYLNVVPVFKKDVTGHITFDDAADADAFTANLGYPTSNSGSNIAALLDGDGNTIGTDASKTAEDGGIKYVDMSTAGIVTDEAGNSYYSLDKIYRLTGGNLSNPYLRLDKVTSAETDATVAVFETTINFDVASTTQLELYVTMGPSGYAAKTNAIYYGYLKATAKGNGITINHYYDYKYADGSTRTAVTTNKSSGAKTGTAFTLRIEYWEADAAEDARIKFYADGALFHETNVLSGYNYYTSGKAPQAEDLDCVNLQLGGSTIADMTIDNVALAQINAPSPKLIGADDSLIDFDINSNGYTPSATSPNTYKVVTDPVTGDGYIEFEKTGGKSGANITTAVTKTEENANLMVFEGDIYIPLETTTVNLQINAGHKHTSGGNGNDQTPFLLTANTTLRNQWVRIRVEYQALEVDAEGKATLVCIRIYENGKLKGSNDPSNTLAGWNITASLHPTGGIYYKATSINQIPLPSEMMNLKIACNQSHDGRVRFDNLSLKLLHVEGCDPTVVTTE